MCYLLLRHAQIRNVLGPVFTGISTSNAPGSIPFIHQPLLAQMANEFQTRRQDLIDEIVIRANPRNRPTTSISDSAGGGYQ